MFGTMLLTVTFLFCMCKLKTPVSLTTTIRTCQALPTSYPCITHYHHPKLSGPANLVPLYHSLPPSEPVRPCQPRTPVSLTTTIRTCQALPTWCASCVHKAANEEQRRGMLCLWSIITLPTLWSDLPAGPPTTRPNLHGHVRCMSPPICRSTPTWSSC